MAWARRPSFTAAQRRRILARYPVCVECKRRPSTIADHEPNRATLVRRGVPNPDDERFGRGMCAECHDIKSRREAAEGRARTPRARRAPEQSPGLTG